MHVANIQEPLAAVFDSDEANTPDCEPFLIDAAFAVIAPDYCPEQLDLHITVPQSAAEVIHFIDSSLPGSSQENPFIHTCAGNAPA